MSDFSPEALIVVLNGETLEQAQALFPVENYKIPLNFALNEAEAKATLRAKQIISLVLLPSQTKEESYRIFHDFNEVVGPFSAFQLVLCEDQDMDLMKVCNEFGIDQFSTKNQIKDKMSSVIEEAISILSDATSAERKAFDLNRLVIQKADANNIKIATESMQEEAAYDFRAAFSAGKACQATGDQVNAEKFFRVSSKVNQHFRPAQSKLADSLSEQGKFEEAAQLYGKLSKVSTMAQNFGKQEITVIAKSGNAEKALEKIKELQAKGLMSESEQYEMQVVVALEAGDDAKALEAMGHLQESTGEFATSLNRRAISLMDKKENSKAIQLFEKAHSVVKKNLKYKISLNAAIALARSRDWQLALNMIERSMQEFGKPYDKAAQLKQKIQAQIQVQSVNAQNTNLKAAG